MDKKWNPEEYNNFDMTLEECRRVKKTTPAIAITSIVCGLGSGLAAYFLIPNDDINWFVGNILALLVPAVIVIIGSLFSRHSFDFKKLEEYEPDHAVNR